jgi:insecticidal toxin complex protein TccC
MADTFNINLLSRLNRETPQLVIYNNQGLTMRSLSYYRRETEKAAEPRVNLQCYDTAGYLKYSVDARLSERYLQEPNSTIPNQSQVNTLSSVVLQSKNVDAGMRIGISDVRGLVIWIKDSLGNERTFEYDKLARMTSVSEKTPEKKVLYCERFVYGDKESKAVNGVSRLLKHYDSAGLHEIKNYSIPGNVLNESRQFLETTTNVDWPEDLTERQKWLETENYTTQWQYNGLGEILCQTDAKDNKHNTQYGIAGEMLSSSLQLKVGTEQTLITKQRYSAAGQLLEKHLNNGVIIYYDYEEKTQRLRRLHSIRLSDNKSLQDLNYQYDPVGNILEIIDKAQEPGFYANEKTEAISQYRYDSLYQLIKASGIESQHAAKESAAQHPAALPLGNPDASRCVNYTRSYEYDASSNLYEIQHRGAQSYTRGLQIADDSNRGIEKRDSGPSLVESFDANGNLLYLNTEQPLQWDSRNQLKQVIQLKRETYSDEEQYRYDASSQRVEKLTKRLAQEQIHSDRVRYLPGLELREHWQTDREGQNKKVTEQLQVIQQGGVRVLHWETGKPDDIENDGLRYTLTDQIGSTQLELNVKGEIISYERYYPYGGTAIWATKNTIEASYKFIRYSGKERDATGLYYYGYRYYLPWLSRWLNPDPSGISDGLNLFRMTYNNPITFYDSDGKKPTKRQPRKRITAAEKANEAKTIDSEESILQWLETSPLSKPKNPFAINENDPRLLDKLTAKYLKKGAQEQNKRTNWQLVTPVETGYNFPKEDKVHVIFGNFQYGKIAGAHKQLTPVELDVALKLEREKQELFINEESERRKTEGYLSKKAADMEKLNESIQKYKEAIVKQTGDRVKFLESWGLTKIEQSIASVIYNESGETIWSPGAKKTDPSIFIGTFEGHPIKVIAKNPVRGQASIVTAFPYKLY